MRIFVRESAEQRGKLQPGRLGSLVEDVVPTTLEQAPPRSLSARFGEGRLPFHMDSAHRLVPARTLVLGCVDPGTASVPTILIETNSLNLSAEEKQLLSFATLLVRTGRKSFFSSVLSSERPFFRYDPGCMEATDEVGELAFRIMVRAIQDAPKYEFHWHQGDVLVINNWQTLHGRGDSTSTADRHLLRAVAI